MEQFLSNEETESKFNALKEQLQELKRFDTEFLKAHSKTESKRKTSEIWKRLNNSIKSLEKDVSDLGNVLSSVIHHSTALEDNLSIENDAHYKELRQFEFMFNASKDWIFLCDSNGHIINLNNAAKKCSIETLKGAVATSIQELLGKTTVQKYIKPLLNSAIQGHHRRESFYCKTPLKSEIWLEVDAFQYTGSPDGQLPDIVLVIRDISERKVNESITQKQITLLDKVGDAVFVLNPKGVIQSWNKGCEEIFGWSKKEAIGKNMSKLCFDETDNENLKLAYDQLSQKSEWTGKLKGRTKAKDDLILSTQWTQYKDLETNKEQLLIIANDVTEKTNLELEFYRTQRIESIGALSSGIAHDLNNVFSMFFLAIQALKPMVKDNKQGSTFLSLIDTSAKRGVDLVKQITNFARGMDGKMSKVSIENLFKELNDFMTQTFPKHILIKIKQAEKFFVYGSATQLHQVFLNLCVNARDAMEKGGDLSIHIEKVKLSKSDISKFQETNNMEVGEYCLIKIQDSGEGIDKDVIDKIFTPFFTTKAYGKGSGLGLSTVKSIVMNHNGNLEVTSKPKAGTTFHIYLPLINKA